jgi:hypothetical protein
MRRFFFDLMGRRKPSQILNFARGVDVGVQLTAKMSIAFAQTRLAELDCHGSQFDNRPQWLLLTSRRL